MIRRAIVDDMPYWLTVKKELSGHFDLSTHAENLKRTPRGFDKNHPCEADLRRRHFIAVRQLSRSEVLDMQFLNMLSTTFSKGAPLMKFLTSAIGLPW